MAGTLDRRFERTRAVLRFILAAFYYLAGFAHLTSPGDFVAMIPWLPAPHTIVMLTGWAELLGATGLLIPRVRKLAGIMLALYAVCVFPANIYQAFAHVPFYGRVYGWNAQALRFALQPVFVWWALFCTNVIDWPFRNARPTMADYYLVSPGPRPPFDRIPRFLWGEDCDYDSDGDSSDPNSTEWTELHVALRPACTEWVDICAIEAPQLVLRIRSDSPDLARRTASFLHDTAGGELKSSWP